MQFLWPLCGALHSAVRTSRTPPSACLETHSHTQTHRHGSTGLTADAHTNERDTTKPLCANFVPTNRALFAQTEWNGTAWRALLLQAGDSDFLCRNRMRRIAKIRTARCECARHHFSSAPIRGSPPPLHPQIAISELCGAPFGHGRNWRRARRSERQREREREQERDKDFFAAGSRWPFGNSGTFKWSRGERRLPPQFGLPRRVWQAEFWAFWRGRAGAVEDIRCHYACGTSGTMTRPLREAGQLRANEPQTPANPGRGPHSRVYAATASRQSSSSRAQSRVGRTWAQRELSRGSGNGANGASEWRERRRRAHFGALLRIRNSPDAFRREQWAANYSQRKFIVMGMARRPPCACLRSAGQARGGLPHWRAGRRRAAARPSGPADHGLCFCWLRCTSCGARMRANQRTH